jgi:beta-glucosidase
MPPVQRTTLGLDFDKFDSDVIKNIREEDKNIPLLTVLLAGRPMLIDNVLSESSAVVSAFLPGTSGGQGIVNAITGKYVIRPNGQSDLKNSLSFDWPKSMVKLILYIGSIKRLSLLWC